jgi:hypothetical protein
MAEIAISRQLQSYRRRGLAGFTVTQDGEVMKAPSVLGLAVEEAIYNDPRFRRDRESVKYGAFFRTLSGTAFLIERITINHINLWIPEVEAARVAAERLGLSVSRSVPWHASSGLAGRTRMPSFPYDTQGPAAPKWRELRAHCIFPGTEAARASFDEDQRRNA